MQNTDLEVLYLPGSIATISRTGLRSMILRPTLSSGLPFTGFKSKKKPNQHIDWKGSYGKNSYKIELPMFYVHSALSSLL